MISVLGIFIILFLLKDAIIAEVISQKREMPNGFWWGLFFGPVGIVVVALRPNDSLKKAQYENLKMSLHMIQEDLDELCSRKEEK